METLEFATTQKIPFISLSVGKVMLLLFFDAHGMILQTVNGDYYANFLKTNLRGAMRKKRPDLLKKQWFLLQDNARPHIAAVALVVLTNWDSTKTSSI